MPQCFDCDDRNDHRLNSGDADWARVTKHATPSDRLTAPQGLAAWVADEEAEEQNKRRSIRGEPLADQGSQDDIPLRLGQALAESQGLDHDFRRQHGKGNTTFDLLIMIAIKASEPKPLRFHAEAPDLGNLEAGVER